MGWLERDGLVAGNTDREVRVPIPRQRLVETGARTSTVPIARSLASLSDRRDLLGCVCSALRRITWGLLQCSVVRRLAACSLKRDRDRISSEPTFFFLGKEEGKKRDLRTVYPQIPSRAGKGDGGPFKVFRHLDLAP